MSVELDFLGTIRRESSRFTECLRRVSPTAPVPSCPGWTAADLLWHLAEVQLFWGTIVRQRLDNPEAAEATTPPRPAEYTELQALARRATAELLETLASTPEPTKVWTWATDHTAGFVLRRQAHEALVHRLDAELTVGEVTSFDPELAADGVDEALRVMYGTAPAWGNLTPDGPPGRLLATDVGMAWQIEFGRFSGTSPDTGNVYDEDVLTTPSTTDMPAEFTLEGSAADLDRWLWGRGDFSALRTSGDAIALERFAAIVASGLQ